MYILFVALLLAVGHIQERALDDGPAVDIALQRRRALDPSIEPVASHETIREADGRRPGLERRNRLGMQLIVVIVDGYILPPASQHDMQRNRRTRISRIPVRLTNSTRGSSSTV